MAFSLIPNLIYAYLFWISTSILLVWIKYDQQKTSAKGRKAITKLDIHYPISVPFFSVNDFFHELISRSTEISYRDGLENRFFVNGGPKE